MSNSNNTPDDKLHQPHNNLFLNSLHHIDVARQFIKTHVPAATLKQLDLKTLKLENTTFVDARLSEKEADVIYSVEMKKGGKAYFFTLLEHQSTSDPLMAFRILVYTVKLMELHIKQHPGAPLPLVWPIVIYSGADPWKAPLDIFPLFGEHAELAKSVFLKPYELIDVQRLSIEDIQSESLFGLVELAFQSQAVREGQAAVMAYLKQLFSLLEKLSAEHPGVIVSLGPTALYYITRELKAENKKLFVELFESAKLPEKVRGEIMNLAQAFKEEGIEEGIQQGIQRGFQQGEAAVLTQLIEVKFGAIPAEYKQLLLKSTPEFLSTLARKIFVAKTLKELFNKK